LDASMENPIAECDETSEALFSYTRLLILPLITIVFQHQPPFSSTVSTPKCSHIIELFSVTILPMTTFYIVEKSVT